MSQRHHYPRIERIEQYRNVRPFIRAGHTRYESGLNDVFPSSLSTVPVLCATLSTLSATVRFLIGRAENGAARFCPAVVRGIYIFEVVVEIYCACPLSTRTYPPSSTPLPCSSPSSSPLWPSPRYLPSPSLLLSSDGHTPSESSFLEKDWADHGIGTLIFKVIVVDEVNISRTRWIVSHGVSSMVRTRSKLEAIR
jgi:hypothetical protein